ncbi:unnamed protein product [Leuciscus chuanchicus]
MANEKEARGEERGRMKERGSERRRKEERGDKQRRQEVREQVRRKECRGNERRQKERKERRSKDQRGKDTKIKQGGKGRPNKAAVSLTPAHKTTVSPTPAHWTMVAPADLDPLCPPAISPAFWTSALTPASQTSVACRSASQTSVLCFPDTPATCGTTLLFPKKMRRWCFKRMYPKKIMTSSISSHHRKKPTPRLRDLPPPHAAKGEGHQKESEATII